MNVLHGLYRSLPHQSGYCIRSKYILEGQRKIDINCMAVTHPIFKSGQSMVESINDVQYYRTRQVHSMFFKVPLLKHIVGMKLFQNRIEELVTNNHIDILHAHSSFFVARPMLNVAKKFSIPFVYEIRGIWEETSVASGAFKQNSIKYKSYRHQENYVIENADAVITISEGIKQNIDDRGLRKDDIHIIPNGLDIKKFGNSMDKDEIAKLKLKYNIDSESIIGYISSFTKMEGIKYLIRSLKYLSNYNVKLLLIGDGPEYSNLNKVMHEENVADKVIFTGKVPHSEVQNFYNLIDIFVIPRVNETVTNLVTPLKPLEAMGMKKAIVASNVGGLSELIIDNYTGLLFESENAEDLAKKIMVFLNDGKKRKEISNNAYEWVREERSWSNIIPKYTRIYKGLV